MEICLWDLIYLLKLIQNLNDIIRFVNLGIDYNIFIPFEGCPISKIGNNMYKNCTGLHSLLSKYYFDSDRGDAIIMFHYITGSSKKILHLGE